MSRSHASPTTQPPAEYNARSRSTALASRGEPMVWLTGAALAVCAVMVVALLASVVIGGSRAFWPRPIVRVTAAADDGVVGPAFLAMAVREESYDPDPEERKQIDAAASAGTLPSGALDADGRPVRRLYRVGNRDFGEPAFVWRSLWRITAVETPVEATLLEREEWGVWQGVPKALVREVRTPLTGPADAVRPTEGAGDGRVERSVDQSNDKPVVVERTLWDSSPAAVMAEFDRRHPGAREVAERIHSLKVDRMGSINRRIEAERLRVAAAEIGLARDQQGDGRALFPASMGSARAAVSIGAGVAGLLCLVAAVRRVRASRPIEPGFLPPPQPARVTVTVALLVTGLVGVLLCLVEGPWHGSAMTPERLASVKAESQAAVERLNAEYASVQSEVALLEASDAQWRLVVTDPATGRFAPERPTEAERPMRLSQVVRAVQPNTLGLAGKVGVYLARWGEFAGGQPRDANTEGGIFPVIVGTVTLTILLSVVVVPLGVVAALYLREYARQGPLTSSLRIAINNLAGVPSIVYGVFGLGFFCYTLGSFIDTGSGIDGGARVSAGPIEGRAVVLWWAGVAAFAAVVVGAVLLGLLSKPKPGRREESRQRWMARGAFAVWVVAAAGAIALIASTPYFHGLFEAKSRSGGGPTMGTKGMLWSAVTLALLTLPLVIVATEEAIAAVPRTVREASLGCGATKWQTIQRVVLPRAMPGIMTGAILAMARGAGEVAPLMLVGAVKHTESLPVDGDAPFLHLDRPFMHLGFHIYDVGFQSQDSEAARPLVWCTTLLLLCVVVSLNATAVRIRTRLRKKFLGEAF
ncbi:MAG TPA: ABC transporter permease subunit [Phycisphaerales bacterium]|nr:ABC transporter permease subunit [Phycisphaerales bacterium]